MQFIQQQLEHNVAKTIAIRWWWKQYSWSAYQLPSGVKVMSLRQMALMVGQPKSNVKEFVNENKLETITVTIPNGAIINANTLPTVAAYLQQLLLSGNLQQHRLSLCRHEWKELIAALSNNDQNKDLFVPNPNFFKNNYRLVTAKPIYITLSNNIPLEILVLETGECHISCTEGLNCIHAEPNWLLEGSAKKLRILTKLNVSPLTTQCQIATQSGIRQVYTLSYDDWLSIWEYFAKHGRKRAIDVLKACAKESIPSRVASLIPMYRK